MTVLPIFLVVLIEYTVAVVISDNSKPTYQIIAEAGYPIEIHDVTTEDGYSVQMHRIPGTGKPIFLMHGFIGSSYDWVALEPGKALAYCLADAGYDVWLGNARGTTYSRNMMNMSSSQVRNYWKFSWHEIGYYDLPTMIDFILATTGQPRLVYVGFSQGTTAFFVMTSTRPEYNNKITAMFALAPIAYVKHATDFLLKLAILLSIPVVSLLRDGQEFLPSTETNALIGGTLCEDGAPTQYLCSSLVITLLGMDQGQINDTMLPAMLGHTPAGVSSRQVLHYGQLGFCGCFRRYDYGVFLNLMYYRSSRPPQYNLNLITVPVYTFSGAKDSLSNLRLGNPMEHTNISNPNWQHSDFVYGKDAKSEVYDLVMNILRTVFSN